MFLNVEHLLRTANTLEQALIAIDQQNDSNDILYDLYRNAAIKRFELSLETAGKLLRKALKAYSATPRSVDALVFNDVLPMLAETHQWAYLPPEFHSNIIEAGYIVLQESQSV